MSGDEAVEQSEAFSVQGEFVADTITPTTRRWIIGCLTALAALAIVGEVILAALDYSTSEALLTVAATAVGGIAGMAVPGR